MKARKGRLNIDWSVQPFGQISDHELARRLGVSRATIARHREEAGITKWPRIKLDVDWRNWPLGVVSDHEVARRITESGTPVTKYMVGKQRRLLGIPGVGPPKRGRAIDWDSLPLGEVPDSKLSKELRITTRRIRRAREERGIAPYKQVHRPRPPGKRARMLPFKTALAIAVRVVRGETTIANAARQHGLQPSSLQERMVAQRRGGTLMEQARAIVSSGGKTKPEPKEKRCLRCAKKFKTARPKEEWICGGCRGAGSSIARWDAFGDGHIYG